MFPSSQTPRTNRTSIIPEELAPGRSLTRKTGASRSLIRADGDFRAGFWCIPLQDRDPARSSLSHRRWHRLRWPKMRQGGNFGSRVMLNDILGFPRGPQSSASPANPVFTSSLNFQLPPSPSGFSCSSSPCASMTFLVGK